MRLAGVAQPVSGRLIGADAVLGRQRRDHVGRRLVFFVDQPRRLFDVLRLLQLVEDAGVLAALNARDIGSGPEFVFEEADIGVVRVWIEAFRPRPPFELAAPRPGPLRIAAAAGAAERLELLHVLEAAGLMAKVADQAGRLVRLEIEGVLQPAHDVGRAVFEAASDLPAAGAAGILRRAITPARPAAAG